MVGSVPGLPAVGHGLIPDRPLHGVVGEMVHLLRHALGRALLQRLDNACMEGALSLREQTAGGDLVGQGVLEGVGALGPAPRLIEELCRLELREAPIQPLFLQRRYSP